MLGEPGRASDRDSSASIFRANEELFDNNPFAYFMVRTGGAIARVNAPFQRITGYATEDLGSKSLEDLLSRRDVQELHGYHREKLRHRNGTFEYECGVTHKGGHEIRVVITMNIVVEGGFGLGALRDVTEERRLSNELRARNVELHRTATMLHAAQEELHLATQTATLGEVSGRVAHEILNPLTAITGKIAQFEVRSEMLAELASCIRRELGAVTADSPVILAAVADVLDEQRRESSRDLALVSSELGRVDRLVHDMRGASRPAIERTRLSLFELLQYCREVMAAVIARSATEDRWSCPREVYIEADRGEIIQAVTNLVRNAIEAHEALPPGVPRVLTVAVDVSASVATIRITDRGAGVPDELAPLIFEPSFTTKPTGTGLGLAISRRLVRTHGGDLALARSGPGATFVMTLPCTTVEPDPPWEG